MSKYVPLVYMSPQNLQTDKPSNFIRRISSFSLLCKGRGLKLATVVPGDLGKVPEHHSGTATANHYRSKGSEEEVREGGQQGRGLRMQNNSFTDKLKGNTATRKAEAALLLLFHSLRRQVWDVSILGA